MSTNNPEDIGFKPPNLYLEIPGTRLLLKIICVSCNNRALYNINEKNIIEIMPCRCEMEKMQKSLIEIVPDIIKKTKECLQTKKSRKS